MAQSLANRALCCNIIVLGLTDNGLGAMDLRRLGHVSQLIRAVVSGVQRHMLNPVRFLNALFGRAGVLEGLAETGNLLVTGAPVLRYLDAFEPKLNELVLVTHAHSAGIVMDFVRDKGFELHASTTDEGNKRPRDPVRDTYCFRREGSRQRIWVQTPKRGLLECVMGQNSSLLLNGFFKGLFFSLCPKASLLAREGVVLCRPRLPIFRGAIRVAEPGGLPTMLEYLGYRLRDAGDSSCHVTLSEGERHIGDMWTWLVGGETEWTDGEQNLSWELCAFQRHRSLCGPNGLSSTGLHVRMIE